MNTKELLAKITQDKKVKDYTYAILFFFISSFFAWFVIRPVLTIAFSLHRQKADLEHVDSVYEKNLNELVDTQSKLEVIRDRVGLLDQALPVGPHTQAVLQSLQTTAGNSGVTLSQISITKINLKTNGKTPETFSVNAKIDGNFGQANNFIKELISQRRIKVVKSMHMVTTSSIADQPSGVRIDFVVEAAYL